MKRVLVTGGESMIGKAIIEALARAGIWADSVPHKECDLLDYRQVEKRLKKFKPDGIIHAAGWNGGIAWCKEYPATIYYRTAMMALNVYHAAINYGKVKKILGILASCSYPDKPTEAYVETDLWEGRPNLSIECHGLSKRIIADYGRQISKQYAQDIECISVVLNNCYGPHDSYHLEKTKVVGALIRRFVEAQQNQVSAVTCWGTGAPLREFVFAPDAGYAIVHCLNHYSNTSLPINISSGYEVSIKELTETIADIVGYTGEICWDVHKPDGQMRKKLDTSLFQSICNMQFTSLRDGLKKTIEWYIANKELADSKGF